MATSDEFEPFYTNLINRLTLKFFCSIIYVIKCKFLFFKGVLMEKFIYTFKHLPTLKKNGVRKILFLLLGCLVLLLQSISWLVVWNKDIDIKVSDMVFVGITLISTFFFIMSEVFFAIRNVKVMNIIKRDQQFSTFRLKLRFSNKTSWGGALIFFSRFLAILFILLFGIMIVSFIQNYLNWGKIILKMPFMALCAVGFLNCSSELRFQSVVEQIK